MVKYAVLRELVGEERFDHALSRFTERNGQEGVSLDTISFMDAEPDNCGLTIEEARDALARAATRSYGLPRISELDV